MMRREIVLFFFKNSLYITASTLNISIMITYYKNKATSMINLLNLDQAKQITSAIQFHWSLFGMWKLYVNPETNIIQRIFLTTNIICCLVSQVCEHISYLQKMRDRFLPPLSSAIKPYFSTIQKIRDSHSKQCNQQMISSEVSFHVRFTKS